MYDHTLKALYTCKYKRDSRASHVQLSSFFLYNLPLNILPGDRSILCALSRKSLAKSSFSPESNPAIT